MFLPVRTLRRLAAAVAVLATVLLGAPPAHAAAGSGYVRLAHLSPDTPAVDVYLRSGSGAVEPQTFRAVAYGDMSRYLRLPAGAYQVAMRKAGAPASEQPVITTEVGVADKGAYTVAGVGRFADLGLRVLRDDLRLPDPGKSKVRIIQASVRAPVLDVAGGNGAKIANGVQFATTTAYREVNPGKWSVRVTPTGGGRPSELPCTLGAGSVYSLVVLDDDAGGLKPELHVDAERQGAVPLGSVATGAGGTAPRAPLPGALTAAAAAALITGALVVVLRRRSRTA
ncbi:DUF4397 domain-containing protein [Paractinoplanes brasiliensis]|uniref:Uncharacterized protein DUF4397 n=1 Tax=Paractinoplanes brasiliensis TaxID=52695 RepID=A0A4R6K0W5_9ACTN|nr:DUF4397 domain-containing protein [Actinoplanes brasiliensis]TDO40795.1 uncharacterized protein DUF4397 [Actinoplanes brasiliensis]GID25864.1 hypothetical protein Abr02nite_08470 [Actinoplanes brasiliensis]